MMQTYSFTEAAPLISFIETHKNKIIGKPIRAFYPGDCFGRITDEPLAFEFDDFVIVLHYFIYSDMTLQIIDPKLFHSDDTLSFLCEEDQQIQDMYRHIRNNTFPYINYKIMDITVHRFSEEFEINSATDETRPDGGDYFSTITVHLENAEAFNICALDALYDGYMQTWT